MQQGDDALGALLTRITRPDWGTTGAAREPSHWVSLNQDALLLLPPGPRAEALCHQLWATRSTADAPSGQRPLEGKPLVLRTVRELLSLPSSGDPRKAATLPIRLLNTQYLLELAAVRGACHAQFGVDLLGSYVGAALDTLFELLLTYWHHYLPPPERLWNEAHALYQLACLQGIDTPGAAPPDAAAQAIRTAYLKPLLMGSLNPARHRPAEIRKIAAFVERNAERARLGGSEGLLCIDPESAKPPTYAGERLLPGCWRLCVRGLVLALDRETTADVGLMPRLKQDLGRYWTRRQVRSELHRRTAQPSRMTLGLEAAHQLLTGCGDDDSLLEYLTPVPALARRYPAAIAARCIDRSSTGAGFRLEATVEEAVLPGTLIATFVGDETDCRLGLIRWVRKLADSAAIVGAQWLPSALLPCAIQRLEHSRVTPLLRAFVHCDGAVGELIAPPGIFQRSDRVVIHTGDGQLSAALTTLRESTFHVARFRICAEWDHRRHAVTAAPGACQSG